jgi:hypothetical protein
VKAENRVARMNYVRLDEVPYATPTTHAIRGIEPSGQALEAWLSASSDRHPRWQAFSTRNRSPRSSRRPAVELVTYMRCPVRKHAHYFRPIRMLCCQVETLTEYAAQCSETRALALTACAANHQIYNRRPSLDRSAEDYTRLDWIILTTTMSE